MDPYLWLVREFSLMDNEVECEYLIAGDDQAASLSRMSYIEVTIVSP